MATEKKKISSTKNLGLQTLSWKIDDDLFEVEEGASASLCAGAAHACHYHQCNLSFSSKRHELAPVPVLQQQQPAPMMVEHIQSYKLKLMGMILRSDIKTICARETYTNPCISRTTKCHVQHRTHRTPFFFKGSAGQINI